MVETPRNRSLGLAIIPYLADDDKERAFHGPDIGDDNETD